MRPIRSLSLILLLSAGPLRAQTVGGAGPGSRRVPAPAQPIGLTLKEVRESFAKADANHSDGLSVDEAAFGGLDAAAFVAGDANSDSKLSLEEFIVASESRAARLGTAAATDLTAESTRLQALRRAQTSEELRARRDARAATPSTAASNSAGSDATTATAQTGPAAARRALAPTAPEDKERSLQELRASIVRRLRNGEISQEDARVALEAIDRRIANSTGEHDTTSGTPTLPSGAAAEKELDLRAVEATLSRRLRNSDLDSAKAADLYDNTIRRIENVRGAGNSQSGQPGETAPSGVRDSSSRGTVGTPPLGFRAKIAEAQGDLTRRLRNAEVTPEQAGLEQAALTRRLRHAAEGVKAGASAPAETSVEGSTTATTGVTAPPAVAPGSQPAPAPARARTDTVPPAVPTAQPTTPPARRESEPASPPARGSTPPPVVQPPPTPAPKESDEPKPARPAPQAPKPACPSGGGGS